MITDFLNTLPVNNKNPVREMLAILTKDDLEWLERSLVNGNPVPTNIINRIDEAFKVVGYPGFTWGNRRTAFYSGIFDFR